MVRVESESAASTVQRNSSSSEELAQAAQIPEFKDQPAWVAGPIRRAGVLLIGSLCRVFYRGFSRFEVYGLDKFTEAVENREKGRGLLTVMNHASVVDEPAMGTALAYNWLWNHDKLRWTVAAQDFCFTNPFLSFFFRLMKALPIVRGAGLEQVGLIHAKRKLMQGDWLHVYPEGRVSQKGEVQQVRRGVARLVEVDEGEKPPIVLPIYLAGIDKVVPLGTSIPKFSKTVTMVVGDAVPYEDILQEFREGRLTRGEYDVKIAARIREHLCMVKEEADKIHEARLRRRLRRLGVI